MRGVSVLRGSRGTPVTPVSIVRGHPCGAGGAGVTCRPSRFIRSWSVVRGIPVRREISRWESPSARRRRSWVPAATSRGGEAASSSWGRRCSRRRQEKARFSATRRTHASGLSFPGDLVPVAVQADEGLLGEVLGGRGVVEHDGQQADDLGVLRGEEPRERLVVARPCGVAHVVDTHGNSGGYTRWLIVGRAGGAGHPIRGRWRRSWAMAPAGRSRRAR